MRRCPFCRTLLIFDFCFRCLTYWPVIITEGPTQ
jgi:hypothetical protein